MRHNQNRRSRGRSRKGPNPLTRSYESNGPDVKVRGTAAHVAEKYMSLARDAHASSDTVAAENYLQHAEHYNRIVMAAQAQFQQSQQQYREAPEDQAEEDRPSNGRMRDRFEYNGEARGDAEVEERAEGGEADEDRSQRGRSSGDEQPKPRSRRDQYKSRDRKEADEHEVNGAAVEEQPTEAAAPEAEEAPAAPVRRRRGRPPRSEASKDTGGEVATEAKESTSDGAAALAAFPD